MVRPATWQCARGESFLARSPAGGQAGSPVAVRVSPPIPYTPANPITAPITTAPIAKGIRRMAAGWGEGSSGISFVILYQLRLCRAVGFGRQRRPLANVTRRGKSLLTSHD